MKALLLGLLVLTISANVHAAAETREYKKDSGVQATVTIHTEETDGTQAAAYVDAQENKKFIEDLLADATSPLAKLKAEIEKESCDANSTPENPWIDGCGEVTITEAVRTSFGRGGWMSGGAGYTFFVGFTSDGSGRFFDVTHMVTISESAEAQVTPDTFDYNGIVIKTLTLDEIKKLEKKEIER
ncbi:MAG: hypothetical protein H7177_05410 [Rhizobacter sp.]|nr:hypothetical protein [Bacteriovorax sp.]